MLDHIRVLFPPSSQCMEAQNEAIGKGKSRISGVHAGDQEIETKGGQAAWHMHAEYEGGDCIKAFERFESMAGFPEEIQRGADIAGIDLPGNGQAHKATGSKMPVKGKSVNCPYQAASPYMNAEGELIREKRRYPTSHHYCCGDCIANRPPIAIHPVTDRSQRGTDSVRSPGFVLWDLRGSRQLLVNEAQGFTLLPEGGVGTCQGAEAQTGKQGGEVSCIRMHFNSSLAPVLPCFFMPFLALYSRPMCGLLPWCRPPVHFAQETRAETVRNPSRCK